MINPNYTTGLSAKQNKQCTVCKQDKPLDAYYKNKTRTDGLHSECKECANKASKERYRTKEGLIKNIYKKQKKSSKLRNHPTPSYTVEELIGWCLSQDIFHELHKDWVDNNYDRNFVPSIDRKDDYDSYHMDNIQLMTFKSNLDKAHSDTRNGINNKRNKAVEQLDKYGNVINTFHSICQAQRKTGIHSTNINNVCNKVHRAKKLADGSIKYYPIKTAGGYYWRYV